MEVFRPLRDPDALDRPRQEDRFLGLTMDGQRYDIGLPVYDLETLSPYDAAA